MHERLSSNLPEFSIEFLQVLIYDVLCLYQSRQATPEGQLLVDWFDFVEAHSSRLNAYCSASRIDGKHVRILARSQILPSFALSLLSGAISLNFAAS